MTKTQPTSALRESKAMGPVADKTLISTVIASTPGLMEQTLRATLRSLPSVQVAGSAAGCLSALQMVRERQADLVVIDSNLPIEDVQVFLRQLKKEGLPTRSLVLTAARSQAQRALAAGADAAFRRDGSIRQLSSIVARLGAAGRGERAGAQAREMEDQGAKA